MQQRWEYRSFVEAWRHAAGVLDRSSQPSLFDRLEWLESLHRHCLPEQAVDILHAREGDAQAWLFLICGDDNSRRAMANWYSFAFRPLFKGPRDPDMRLRLITQIASRLAKRVGRLELFPVTADDGTTDLLLKSLGATGWLATATPVGVNHVLDLKGRDFQSYWSGRPGPLRTLVQRKGRGNPFDISIHHEVTDALWADYMRVYAKSWKNAEPFAPFLHALAEQEARAGTLRLGFARRNGEPVAAQLWTVENDVALIHKLAHDAACDAQSPGTLLSHDMFRAAIDDDHVSRIDYGTGNNAYKTDWMDSQRPLYRIDAYNPRFASAWLPAARAGISGLVARSFKR